MYTFAKFSTKEKNKNLDASFKQRVNPKKATLSNLTLRFNSDFSDLKIFSNPRQHHTIVLTNYNSSHNDCLLNSQLITEIASKTWISPYLMWGKNELNKVSEPDSILYDSLKLKIILTALMQGSKLFSMKKASDYLISTKHATDED